MKVTKLGHCCLLIDTGNVVVLTDPGEYTVDEMSQVDVPIHVILITHEHSDHYHVASIKRVLEKNPDAIVVTNTSVKELLKEEGIDAVIIEDGDVEQVADVSISGHGDKHAALHSTISQVQNTGFVIDESFYHPGDAFHVPDQNVDILALPVAGPWMKISEAIDFALEVNPKVAFPVHDDVLASKSGGAYKAPEKVLTDNNIEWRNITNNVQVDFTHV